MSTKQAHRRASCPVARAISVIGDQWSLLIVRDAFDGVSRFGDFQASTGIARNILAARLKALVADGVLATLPASDGSPYFDYVLTDAGRALFPVIVTLRQWGEDRRFQPGEKRSRLVERASGRTVPRIGPTGSDGKPLQPENTVVKKVGSR